MTTSARPDGASISQPGVGRGPTIGNEPAVASSSIETSGSTSSSLRPNGLRPDGTVARRLGVSFATFAVLGHDRRRIRFLRGNEPPGDHRIRLLAFSLPLTLPFPNASERAVHAGRTTSATHHSPCKTASTTVCEFFIAILPGVDLAPVSSVKRPNGPAVEDTLLDQFHLGTRPSSCIRRISANNTLFESALRPIRTNVRQNAGHGGPQHRWSAVDPALFPPARPCDSASRRSGSWRQQLVAVQASCRALSSSTSIPSVCMAAA